jgi:glutathione S-transferase
MSNSNSNVLKLVIGNKNLSSWSMRAWLAAKASNLPFDEILVFLDQDSTKVQLQKLSPSERVPCLIHNDLHIWDSLAICEYLAEIAPNQNLWPKDPAQRAIARSYVSEMHSGFQSLRTHLSMDIRLKMSVRHISSQTILEIQRILQLWESSLKKSKGPFLFGTFGIADAFFAPVVFRFLSYGIEIKSPLAHQYMNSIESHPLVREWVSDALKEEYQPQTFG